LPQQTLSVWTAESGERLKLLKELGTKFEAAHPNVKVAWTERDFGSYPAQIKLALSSQDGPDVAIGNLGWSLDGPLIKAGLFRPLDDYSAAYGWDKRYPEIGLRQLKFTADGKVYGEGPIWGVPYAADVIGWFYNTEQLKATGLPVPTTMAELDKVLAASKAAGQQPIVFGNKDAWPAWHLAYNLIDQYASAETVAGIVYGKDGAAWTDPAIAQALDKMLEWKKAGYIADDVNSVVQADASAAFIKGKGLFFPAGSWEAAAMPAGFGFFLTPPLEAGTPARATGSFGYAFHVAANSTEVPAAAAFLDFVSNEDAAKAFFAAGDIAPLPVASPQLKEGQVYSDIYSAWSSVLKADSLLPYLEFATPTSGEILYPSLQKLLAGKEKVPAALTAIEADRQKFIAENR
jgi:raffinose/stachyose/melibiose transport system substrate-binding protein